jgi:hypothetical protein
VWPSRSNLGATLALATLIELLEAAEHTFYVELLDVPVWCGCELRHSPAPKFQRRTSLALFLQPSEMVLDPWRVRKLRKEPLAAEHPGAALMADGGTG